MQILGWLGVVIVIVAYFLSTERDNSEILHWGNVIGACILVPVQLLLDVPFAAALSFCFGLIGLFGLVREHKNV